MSTALTISTEAVSAYLDAAVKLIRDKYYGHDVRTTTMIHEAIEVAKMIADDHHTMLKLEAMEK